MSDSPSRKRSTKQKGWRIDAELADEFTSICEQLGLNPNRQVEFALRVWIGTKGVPVARHKTPQIIDGPDPETDQVRLPGRKSGGKPG
jgi:hypothetical protein